MMPDPNPNPNPQNSGAPADPTPHQGGKPDGSPAPASSGQPTPPASSGAPSGKPDGSQDPASSGQQSVPLTALQEEREKRQQAQAELESLRKLAGQSILYDREGNPVMAQPQQQPAPDNNNDVRRQIDQLWDTDPRKAVQAELMVALNWYDGVNIALDNQEAELADKEPGFNDYRDKVRRIVRTLPPDQRGKPGIVKHIYDSVRGQSIDDIVKQRVEAERAELMRRIQAGESVQGLAPGAVSNPPAPSGAVNLTDDQRKACAALGISESDYIANMVKR
jgi:hypothetical protein